MERRGIRNFNPIFWVAFRPKQLQLLDRRAEIRAKIIVRELLESGCLLKGLDLVFAKSRQPHPAMPVGRVNDEGVAIICGPSRSAVWPACNTERHCIGDRDPRRVGQAAAPCYHARCHGPTAIGGRVEFRKMRRSKPSFLRLPSVKRGLTSSCYRIGMERTQGRQIVTLGGGLALRNSRMSLLEA